MDEDNKIPLEPLLRGEPFHTKNWKRIKLFYIIGSLLDKTPSLKHIIIIFLQQYRVFVYKSSSKKFDENESIENNVDKLYWINPNDIYYASIKEFDVSRDKGKVCDGEWDLLEKSFEKIAVFVAFQERFIQGKDWENTVYYQRILTKIHQGEYLWNCKNKSDLDIRFKNLEQLYTTIKNNGYRSQREILNQKKVFNPLLFDDEITVNIGRHGDLLFNNGAHRLAIVKLLNIDKIPVKITVRHQKWMEFKEQILLYSKDQFKKKIYAPLTHIDLQDIPSFHDSSEDRFNAIRSHLTVTKGCLLDIGANWGYFCQQFEAIGFKCYAVENDQTNIYFLKKLKRANNNTFKIISKSIFDYDGIEKISFNVVLALNIFHHFLKNEIDYNKLIIFLKTLKVQELYFQPHNPTEPQMNNAYKNYSEKDFVNFILENSTLSHVEQIFKGEYGRNIFKFY
jgi:hypothetical protein